jgi:hypothetical protein
MIAARGFSGRPIPDQPSRTATSISIVHRFGVGTAVYGEVIPDQPSRIPRAVLRLAARSTRGGKGGDGRLCRDPFPIRRS